ncbi:hypothetical protein FN846DRAFT_958498 [Sphaerosporella brunnea]|uniref:Uncharacterized protein n=1 Tax=Sphaerosporella brunnea TaxID=1250544 RepID=A0A5J5ERQ3_9PEZI|nr:hypothetical protein FN846DRAFT_958498 [Sphaerosporella brunnea]
MASSNTSDLESSISQAQPSPPLSEHYQHVNDPVPGYPLILEPLDGYLKKQLSVTKLDKIFQHLWWAGRPGNIRTLHQQVMMKREVLPCENISLHLVWHDTTIYIKPIPAWLLDPEFVAKNITPDKNLWLLANGFLKTYTKLVMYPNDFKIAQEKGLLPEEVDSWKTWSAIAASLNHRILDTDDHVHKRYKYGELRLRRLNHICRFWGWGKSYHSVYVQYDSFFAKNFAWLLMVVVYVSAILSSMQVVLATPRSKPSFIDASYWFSVMALVIIGFGVTLQAVLFVVLFLYHLVCTIHNLQMKGVPWLLFNWLPSPKRRH